MIVLRDEAVACLGDVVGFTPKTFTVPTNINEFAVALAPSGSLAAVAAYDGTIRLLKMPSGKQIARLVGTNGVFCQLCFNSTGNQLFALAGGSLYRWTPDAGGRWRETVNSAAHGYDLRFINDVTGVFASAIDLRYHESHNRKVYRANFRLFDLETGAFVPGYNVTYSLTNGWPFGGLRIAKGPARWLIAMAIKDSQNTNSPVTISLYDWKSGRRINQLHSPGFETMSLSPDGKYLACFSAVGGAIYTVPGLARIGQFTGTFNLPFVTFGRSKVAMPIYQPSQIRLWNLLTRKDIVLLDEPEYAIPVALASDGNSLLTWAPDTAGKQLRFYRLATPEKLDLPSHAAAVTGIAFSPDGMNLASVGKDRVIRVCDAMTGRILWQTNDLPGLGQCVGYSPDGHWLATGDWDTDQVWIWDAHTGKLLLELGTNGPGRTWSAQFSPDGRYLATAGSEIRVYRIQREKTADGNGHPVATLIKRKPFDSYDLMFAPAGRFLTFARFSNFHLFAWDYATSSQPRDTGLHVPWAVQTGSFVRDGRYLLGLDSKGKITTLAMPSGKEISSFQVRKANDYTADGLCLSPDGSRLAIVSTSNLGVEVWNPKTRQRLYSLPEDPGKVYWLAWSPDGQRLAIARDNGHIAIWNLETVGQTLAELGLSP